MPTTAARRRFVKINSYEIPTPIITKEHGSWAVLLVPILVSAGVAGKWNAALLLLVLSSLSFFLAYVPAQLLLRQIIGGGQMKGKEVRARFWTAGYSCAGALFALPLLTRWPLLLAVGALGILSFLANFFLVRRFSKSIGTDFIAVAGLTLTGPASYYVLTGLIDRTTIVLYVLNILFFGCSVFYVHMKIRAASMKSTLLPFADRLFFGRLKLLYYLTIAVILGILAAMQWMTFVVLAAFTPMIIHGVYGTITLSGKVRFKNLGFLLLAQSIVFGLLVPLFVSR